MDLSKAVWRKASRSTENGGDCVEVADAPGTVAIRDSKNPGGPELVIDRRGFRHFVATLKGL